MRIPCSRVILPALALALLVAPLVAQRLGPPESFTPVGIFDASGQNQVALDSNALRVAPAPGTSWTTSLGANQSVNLTQLGGAAVLVGNGVTGTGSLRVTVASDNTAFGVNLAQYTPVTGRLPVDGSGVTQPVSGTITANAGTGNFASNLAQYAGATVSVTNAVHIRNVSDVIVTGTQASTTTAAALTTTQASSEVLVQNDPDNTVDILIGDATSQVIQLAPGQSITIPINDPSEIQVKTVSGTATTNFILRR